MGIIKQIPRDVHRGVAVIINCHKYKEERNEKLVEKRKNEI